MLHTGTNQPAKRTADQCTRIQHCRSETKFTPPIPAREIIQTAREVGRLHETEEEAHSVETSRALTGGRGGGDDAPQNHARGKVDGGFADFVEEKVGRDLH